MKKLAVIVALFAIDLFVLPASLACSQTAPKSSPSNSSRSVNVASAKSINVDQLFTDVRTLSADDMQGRRFGTPGGAKAREYVVRRFSEIGLSPLIGNGFVQSVNHGEGARAISGANVVGHIRGKTQSDQLIVVTAHYDHLGIRDGKVYSGADDNASGVAGLLQLAKFFKEHPPAKTIVFAALDAEEGPGAGARTIVKSLLEGKYNVVINVNLDMISHNDRGELYAVGTYHYPHLKQYIDRVARNASVKLLTGHDQPAQGSDDWTRLSDHYAFHREKIPFIYFGVEDHKDYHKPSDKFETITQEFFVHAVETVLEVVKTFDAQLNGTSPAANKSDIADPE